MKQPWFPFLIVGTLVIGILLAHATRPPAQPKQSGSWENINDRYEFTYSWDGKTVLFSVSEGEALKAYNRIKPEKNLSVPEKVDLFLLQPPEQKGLRPTLLINYPKMARESQAPLMGLTQALTATAPAKDARSLAAHALSFVQSIPYSRTFSNGTDYQTPIGVLLENKGDCDSKSTLLAALLANWGIPWTVLCSNNIRHAIAGIGVDPVPGDETITQNGRTFVVAETTTSGWKLGKTSPTTSQELENGGFGVIRNKSEQESDKQQFLTLKIEEAKRLTALYNRQLIGQEAEGKMFSKWLDIETIETIREEIAAERLTSFGLFPNPNKTNQYPTVQWAGETQL